VTAAMLGSGWLRSMNTWGTRGGGLELEVAVIISARRLCEGVAVGAEQHWEWGVSGKLCFASKLRQWVRATHLGRDRGR
jgi:hypothetical protein